ncbi:MAG TPA: hypothetical protein VGB24_16110 [Longimicrobium sp.]|jgi:hypothetical protein|uniref:hypothetical protein n=1 Tax=Longimicrobium sp. TaxID=2029185 RepID=UPI002ED91DBE
MMRIDSSWIHPMRYGRTRPFGRELAQLADRRAGRGFLALDDLNALLARVMGPYNDAIDHLPREARPARPTPILNAEVSLATSVGRFKAWGRNIFWLTPALVEMLEHTDLSGVHLGDLQFPYDMCYVGFGDRLAVGLPGPPNQVDGAYVEQRPEGIAIHITARRLDPGSQSPRTWPLNQELVYTTVLQGAPEDALDALLEADVEERVAELEQMATRERESLVIPWSEGDPVSITYHLARIATEDMSYLRSGAAAATAAVALAVNALCYLTTSAGAAEAAAPGRLPDDVPRAPGRRPCS